MSYSNPNSVTYAFNAVDFGVDGGTFAIKSPDGFENGRLVDVGISVTETFTVTTAVSTIRIGVSTDLDAYATLNITTAAAAQSYFNTENDTDAITDPDLPGDTTILITCSSALTASPAGIGNVYVTVDWF